MGGEERTDSEDERNPIDIFDGSAKLLGRMPHLLVTPPTSPSSPEPSSKPSPRPSPKSSRRPSPNCSPRASPKLCRKHAMMHNHQSVPHEAMHNCQSVPHEVKNNNQSMQRLQSKRRIGKQPYLLDSDLN